MDQLHETIKNDFLELSSIDSISFHEREMVDNVKARLEAMGFEVEEDNAGEIIGGNAGNIHAYLKGDMPGEPIFFSSHLDTVVPGIGKKAIVDGDIITSDGTTVLGGDDLTGVIAIMRGADLAIKSGKPHRDMEILFTVAEEVFVKGAKAFDYGKLRAREGYILDTSGKPGHVALKAPSIIQFEARMTGKAAHAGFEPEKGIHAIVAMSEAVTKMTMGRPTDDSTFNVGTINGGFATNIVPEVCTIKGEARSFRHEYCETLVRNAQETLKETADKHGVSLEFESVVATEAFSTPEDAPVVKRFSAACEAAGVEPDISITFGGSDNNYYAKQGLSGIVMATGMDSVHSTNERCSISHMATCAKIVEALLQQEV